jgi:hypothetical protein
MLLCPATVAIHDYGDVPGQLIQIYFRFNIHYLILGACGFFRVFFAVLRKKF